MSWSNWSEPDVCTFTDFLLIGLKLSTLFEFCGSY